MITTYHSGKPDRRCSECKRKGIYWPLRSDHNGCPHEKRYMANPERRRR